MIKFFQTFKNQPLKGDYWGELFGVQLSLRDTQGNLLTFYKSEFEKLTKLIQDLKLDISSLSPQELIQIINSHNQKASRHDEIQMIKYFSKQNLKDFELSPETSDFSKPGTISTRNGTQLEKRGHQNCLVMLHNGSIYAHPKVRPNMKEEILGVNHSSLSSGKGTLFAGSLIHHPEKGWIVENTTGHYGTRATQMRQFLMKLQDKKFPIHDLRVKLWISKNPANPSAEESDYDILEENALTFLQRTSASIRKMDDDEGYSSRTNSPTG